MSEPTGRKTTKQQRAEARAERVRAHQQQEAARKRNRRIAAVSGAVGGAAVIALVITFVATSTEPVQRPQDIEIAGLTEFPNLPATHIDPAPVDYQESYGMAVPAGGDHSQIWLNCGVYSQPQQNENAVHALEHGAVWVTYDPDVATDEDISALRNAIPDQYTILSPYPGQPAPFMASAWGAQIEMESVSDARLAQFIDRYWKSADAPEPGASCSGALQGPGLVA
ncbi:DUF3105 domain-containing protein [Leucobacter aridicollis]|uniref:DUF3105 domain-containing protein n=1 Tax=Leucobacter aridicollis TaxID=283878 RepID=A0A852R653_9MICO|nr:DUF3105 domain-containing protein [Leucobacter aridicollis]MBL3682970.1 DUF3105 domain-containing protein [Leucobacter aridicollis]NYD26408.1 hypothetical protein [Leucobacter aridicollis]